MPSGKNAMPTPIRPLLEGLPLFADDPILSITPIAHQGYCNLSYKVTTQTTVYLVRILKQEGIDRTKEYTLQNRAADAGIAPRVLLLDEAAGVMVTAFVDGVHRERLSPKALQNLAERLRKLHDTVQWDEPVVDISSMIRSQEKSIQDALEKISAYPVEPVVCHNDPNPRNILWQHDTPIFIDFEYAGVNDRYFDLAAVCVEFELNHQEEEILLQWYFTKQFWHEKLTAFKILYRVVCQQWFAEHQSRYSVLKTHKGYW